MVTETVSGTRHDFVCEECAKGLAIECASTVPIAGVLPEVRRAFAEGGCAHGFAGDFWDTGYIAGLQKAVDDRLAADVLFFLESEKNGSWDVWLEDVREISTVSAADARERLAAKLEATAAALRRPAPLAA